MLLACKFTCTMDFNSMLSIISFLFLCVWCWELHVGLPLQVLFFNWNQNLCGGHPAYLCLITSTIASYGVMNGQIMPALFAHLWLSHCFLFVRIQATSSWFSLNAQYNLTHALSTVWLSCTFFNFFEIGLDNNVLFLDIVCRPIFVSS